MNLNFGSINKSAITEEKINGAICFVVTESNRQFVSHNARVNFGNSDIFGNFSSVLRVLREG